MKRFVMFFMVFCFALLLTVNFTACSDDDDDDSPPPATARIDNWTSCYIWSVSYHGVTWGPLDEWEGPTAYKQIPLVSDQVILVAENSEGDQETYSSAYMETPESGGRYTLEIHYYSYTCGDYYWEIVDENTGKRIELKNQINDE